MRILVVDDHVLFREGLVKMLDNQPGTEVVGQTGFMQDAIVKARDLRPDLILMDLMLPDGDGLEATKTILSESPDIKILMLTVHESRDMLMIAMQMGAKGYLMKNTPLAKLMLSLRAVERGELALSRAMVGWIMEEYIRVRSVTDHRNTYLPSLTPRELEVLKHLGTGASNREIAERMSIAETTVKIYVHNILDKLKLKNRHEAGKLIRRIEFETSNYT